MKTLKNLTALLLSATTVASIGVTAFATTITDPADPTGTDVSSATVDMSATGTTVSPTIKVNVPATMSYVLNPYQVEGKAQILAPKFSILNKSDVPVNVMVSKCSPSATLSGITLATKAPTDKSTEKEAFIYLRATVGDSSTPTDVKTGEFTKATATVAGDVALTSEAMTAPVLLASLVAGDGTDPTTGKGEAVATFMGALSAPKETPWATTDKFDITVSYQFIPQMNTVTK